MSNQEKKKRITKRWFMYETPQVRRDDAVGTGRNMQKERMDLIPEEKNLQIRTRAPQKIRGNSVLKKSKC